MLNEIKSLDELYTAFPNEEAAIEHFRKLAQVPKAEIDERLRKGHKAPGPKKTRARRAKRG